MSNIFVRSTDGNDADNGSTWALAKATIKGAAAIDANGDTIYVSQVHAETTSDGDLTGLAGTIASPVKIIGGNDAAEPPTNVSNAAQATSTGTWTLPNTPCYVRGIQFHTAAGGVNAWFDFQATATPQGNQQSFEKCQFYLDATGAAAQWKFGGAANSLASLFRWLNCDIKAASTNNRIQIGDCTLEWRGGSILAGGTALTTLFEQSGGTSRAGNVLVEGVDLSQLDTTCTLMSWAGSGAHARSLFRNCKLPASWTGALSSGMSAPGQRTELYNCDAGDTNYRLWIDDYFGSIKHETTLVRTGGASDGVTPLSWKMVSIADTEYPHLLLRSPEIARWNDTVGSAITVDVDVLHDSVTNLKDNEVWLEVEYLGTSGVPLGSFASDAKADVLAAAADQTASSSAWTATGMTNPNKQKLSVTFTPQEKGFIHAIVHLAKASYTVYVDPQLQVS
jgi:hypothetical protein